jgi:hypothetical protein
LIPTDDDNITSLVVSQVGIAFGFCLLLRTTESGDTIRLRSGAHFQIVPKRFDSLSSSGCFTVDVGLHRMLNRAASQHRKSHFAAYPIYSSFPPIASTGNSIPTLLAVSLTLSSSVMSAPGL